MAKQIHSLSDYKSSRLTLGIRQNFQTGGQIQHLGRTLDKQPRFLLINPVMLKLALIPNTLDWIYGTHRSPKLQHFTQTNSKLK